MEGKITSFKLNGTSCSVSFNENITEKNDVTNKSHTIKVARPASNNLRTIGRALIAHAIYYLNLDQGKITEKEFKARSITDGLPEFKMFRFVGFSLKGDGEKEKVVIHMEVYSRGDKASPLSSQPIGLFDGSYAFDEYLQHDVEQMVAEVEAYIAGENYYSDPELPFPEPVSESEENDF